MSNTLSDILEQSRLTRSVTPKNLIWMALKYPELEYACIHGGKPHKSAAQDSGRPNQRYTIFKLVQIL